MENGVTDASTQDADSEVEIEELIADFEDAFDNSTTERAAAERDRDYYDGDQLSEEELEALRKRRQPAVVSNRIGPKIDTLIGHEQRMRTEPKAYPRTPQHEADANSATDSIRFVCDQNNFDQIRSSVAENMFIEGIGAASVTVQDPKGKRDIKVNEVPWDRFYRDQHSRRPDFRDARFMGEVLWMDESEAQEKFPGKEDVIESCYAEGNRRGDTYDDRPQLHWGDRKRKRIRVLHHRFLHKGQWWVCILCRGGFLWEPQVSPYLDEDDRPTCDLIPISAYVKRDNERYGAVRRHISPQDEINKRRSKALHLLNSKKIIAEKGATEGSKEQARREAARPDGYIEVVPNMRFEFVNEQELVQGQFSLLQEAKAEIDISGVNPALGGDQNAPSGRAQEMQISAGLAEHAKIFDALRHWSWDVYRQIWYRIRQYWTEEKWIRVTDDEKNLRWVRLNYQMTRRDQVMEQLQAAQAAGRPMDLNIDPSDPAMDQVIGKRNDLGQLDVDIILEDAPESVNLQSEQFQALVELKKADPSAIPTKAIIQASTIRNKDEILDYLDKQQQGQIPPQVQQQMQELQQQLQQAQEALQQAQNEQATEQQRQQLEAEKNERQQANEMEIAKYKADREFGIAQLELESKERTAIEVARINASAKVESSAAMGAKDASHAEPFVQRSEAMGG